MIRSVFLFCATVTLLPSTLLLSKASGDDLWLASGAEYRGRLRVSEQGKAPRVVFTRTTIPDPAYRSAVTRVAQIAVGPKNEVFYCSGLDRSVMQLLDGRNEIQVLEAPEQVRDLACTQEAHTVYYSVLATPTEPSSVPDGKIFRRDLWDGQATEVASVRQADVGGNWWGVFAMRGDEIFIATLDKPSRIYKLTGATATRVFPQNAHAITGLSVGAEGEFLYTDGTDCVHSTLDFNVVTSVLKADLKISDVAQQARDLTH